MSRRSERRATARERGYTSRWERARASHLAAHPLCVHCYARGIVRAASVVNHRTPHRGDSALFWDEANWEAVCKSCHDGPIQSQERAGRVYSSDVGADGWPIDAGHPVNRGLPKSLGAPRKDRLGACTRNAAD